MNDLIAECYCYKDMESPVGQLRLIAHKQALVAVLWNAGNMVRIGSHGLKEEQTHHVLLETERQLKDYFEKKRTVFDLPLDLVGTDFQKKVWQALLNIPFGKTTCYGDLAKQLGDVKAVRAVGGALNKNPISIIVPCHRVIGASGDLTGFAGGLSNKMYLLELEDPNKQLNLWD